MEFDASFFSVALPAAFVAGVAKGGFGGGPAFVATALLALVISPTLALGIMLPLLILADLVTLRPFWRQWDAAGAKALIYGCIPGVLLGAGLYQVIRPDLLGVLIGLIALLFVLFQIARERGWIEVSDQPLHEGFGLAAGAVAGFTGFVSHAAGPPAAMYLLSKRMGKTNFQASMVLVLGTINALKVVPYASLGLFSLDTLKADAYMVAPLLAGCTVGVYAHRALPERVFFLITYVLLAGAGSKLIHDGLT